MVFIAANCITLAMERPNIPPWSLERRILDGMNNIFTVVFTIEMFLKVSEKLKGVFSYSLKAFVYRQNMLQNNIVIYLEDKNPP